MLGSEEEQTFVFPDFTKIQSMFRLLSLMLESIAGTEEQQSGCFS